MPIERTTFKLEEIKKYIQHRDPFLLIDEVSCDPKDIVSEDLNEAERLAFTDSKAGDLIIKSKKFIDPKMDIFRGHFPDYPILPGVLSLEAMAQTACFFVFYTLGRPNGLAFFTHIDGAKFKHPVHPGDTLEMEIKYTCRKRQFWIFEGKSFVNGNLSSQASFKAFVSEKEDK
ncbi:MAG: hypothetical protein JJV93_01050 [Alphaproteobacteria bacterium]|nr:hypothetical protein [Alphaproteobacteria bacterium]MBL0717839.1 hypothetical protein [Alphaproteobacteria bacterium]